MRLGRIGAGVAVILAAAAALAAGASAAPKSGCPATQSGWSEVSVGYAAERIWPGILDTSPWHDDFDTFLAFVATYDRNDDDDVCLLVMWGEDLNPNSHWYKVGMELLGSPTEQYFVHENTANAADG